LKHRCKPNQVKIVLSS